MSADIEITPPAGLPDPREPISGMARADGNVMMATETVGFGTLDTLDELNAAKALIAVIAEIDKADAGVFSDAWWIEADRKWSKGLEMRRYLEEYEIVFRHFRDHCAPEDRTGLTDNHFWGKHRRETLRAEAFRFLMYYLTGYKITWTW